VRIQVDDINGDEASGKDQTMVPMDFDGKNGHIIDDVIYSEVVGKLPEGCELFCLFDCCHSGTIMDLPYVIAVTPAVEKEIEKVRERERAWVREQAKALASDSERERERDVSVSVCVCVCGTAHLAELSSSVAPSFLHQHVCYVICVLRNLCCGTVPTTNDNSSRCHLLDLTFLLSLALFLFVQAMGSGQAMPGMQDSEVHANKIVDGKRGKGDA